MGKILIISYFFPPIGGGGVLRVAKFAKYLDRLGWQVKVLTVKRGFYPITDPTLLNDLSRNIEINRVNYPEPGFFLGRKIASVLANLIYPLFLIPDNQILWFLPAIFKARQIIRHHHIKIIFTSSRSYSDHLIALVLKRLTGVKWVADFRDLWTRNPEIKFPTPLHLFCQQKLERLVVQNADKVITISGAMTESFQKLSSAQKKFSTITNGFDKEDFPKKPPEPERKYCQFIYTGSLYGGRKIVNLLAAIKEINQPQLKLKIIGPKERLSHQESLNQLYASNILLLILSPQDTAAVYSGKIFEYLATGKPILALAPKESAAAKLIIKLKAGIVVDPQDKEAIKKAIENYFQLWQSHKLEDKKFKLKQFDRFELTKKFEKILSELEPKRKPRICFIGDLSSIHNQRFVAFFKNKYEIHFISSSPAKVSGIKIYYLGQRRYLRRWTPWEFFVSTYRIRSLVREIGPDIIHGQNLIFGGLWASLANWRPLVISVWGSDIFRFKEFIFPEQYLIRRALKKANLIVGSSLVLKDGVQKIGIKTRKFREIQFGVESKLFKPASKNRRLKRLLKSLGILAQDRVIFCPRFIKPVYNTKILLEAFSYLKPREKHLKLLLIRANADQKFFRSIQDLITELKITKDVIFFGQASRQEMVKLYNLAEIVVSIPSYDSSAVSVLEAMACGRKLVLSDIPYVREWYSSQIKNFYLAKAGNEKSTAEAILRALSTSDFTKIALFNRNLVSKKADYQTNMHLMDKLYQELIAGGRIEI